LVTAATGTNEEALLDRYGVDLVVLPSSVAGSNAFAGKTRLSANYGAEGYQIVKIRECAND
jgi:hypothetical protein